ncbi:unnamed protein product [Trypanosoma congolense IL3000]|uniref:WGS project CAEQ00000000 data, annotated contig 1671 n=1 Tax=Trypanosoma congolense (strain IL3000) TaxID=1068625 RepID=F9W7X3_TRYCI|nr:unnamed protein product [Trypanosoma congolense IL3000]
MQNRTHIPVRSKKFTHTHFTDPPFFFAAATSFTPFSRPLPTLNCTYVPALPLIRRVNFSPLPLAWLPHVYDFVSLYNIISSSSLSPASQTHTKNDARMLTGTAPYYFTPRNHNGNLFLLFHLPLACTTNSAPFAHIVTSSCRPHTHIPNEAQNKTIRAKDHVNIHIWRTTNPITTNCGAQPSFLFPLVLKKKETKKNIHKFNAKKTLPLCPHISTNPFHPAHKRILPPPSHRTYLSGYSSRRSHPKESASTLH